MSLRLLDLFAGIGGFSLAAHRAGMETVAFAEIDPFASAVLAERFPDVPNLGDVRAVDGTKLRGRVDVVTFGSPCQDLSVAGRRGGLAGERSGLFFEAIRIVAECRPAFAIWENVPGAFSTNGGRDFAAVLDALADIGAVDIAWRVLDAQHFGVPQRRRRVFIVADFGAERAGAVLFEPQGVRRHPAPRRAAGEEVAGSLTASSGGGRYDKQPHVVAGDVAPTVSAKWSKGTGCPAGDECQNLIAFDLAQATHPENRTAWAPGRPAPTVAARSNLHIAHTLTRDQTPAVMSAGVRRLSPREAERLQGFPDDWTLITYRNKPATDGPRYRALGNSVAVPVVEWIMRRLVSHVQA